MGSFKGSSESNKEGDSDDINSLVPVNRLQSPSSEKQESVIKDEDAAAVTATTMEMSTTQEADRKNDAEDTLPRLEEEVALQQLTLQSLSNKKRLLELQIELERSKKRKHVANLESLQARKKQLETSRETHLNLFYGVKRHLDKCEERYKRIIPSGLDLEPSDILDGGERIGNQMEGSENVVTSVETADMLTTRETGEQDSAVKGNSVAEESISLERQTSLASVPFLRSDRRVLKEFWSSSTSTCGLTTFIPFIDSSILIQKIMNILALETLSLERTHPNASKHRAQSILGTCLDMSSYRSKALHQSIQGIDDTTVGSLSNDEIIQVDANVILCPYELSGECADVHCLYQHTKERSGLPSGFVVPREFLPLPQLKLPAAPSPLSKDREVHAIETHKTASNSSPTTLPRNKNVDLSEETSTERVKLDGAEDSMEVVDAAHSDVEEDSKNLSDESVEIEISEENTSQQIEAKEDDAVVIDWGENPDFIGLPAISPPATETTSSDESNNTTNDNKALPWTTLWWSNEKDTERVKSLKREKNDFHSLLDTLYLMAGFQVRPATTYEDTTHTHAIDKPRRDCPINDLVLCFDLSQLQTTSEITSFCGRVVDCTRLMIHAGRYDISEALHETAQNATNRSRKLLFAQENSCKESDEKETLLLDILDLALNYVKRATQAARNHNSDKRLFIACETEMQIVLAVLSEHLRLVSIISEDVSLEDSDEIRFYSDALNFLDEAFSSTFDRKTLQNDPGSSANQNMFETILHRLKSMLHNNTPSMSPLESLMKKDSEEERALDVVTSSMQQLLADFQLGQSLLSNQFSLAESSTLCEGLLKPLFSEVRSFLKREESNVVDGSINPLLRVVTLIGYLFLGVVEMFTTNPSSTIPLDQYGNATVTEIDTCIYQYLQHLLREVRSCTGEKSNGLLELTLSPLCSFSVSLPTCLGEYAKAQHRLEVALDMNAFKIVEGGNFTFGVLSDLFWSSIVQLRGLLPTPERTGNDENLPKFTIPLDIVKEHEIISERITSYGVHLNHISLIGDWNLIRELNNPDSISHDSFRESCSSLIRSLSTTETSASDREDNLVFNLNHVPLRICRMEVKDTVSEMSAVPLSILLCGTSIMNLQMQGCRLQSLPLSFGIYLDRLQNLDLSNNSLESLPDSIGKLKALCYFDISSNRLSFIQDQVGKLQNLKKLYASNNQITDIPPSLLGCRMLELLDLRHNKLKKSPPPELPLKLTKLTTLLVDGNPIER